MIPHLCKNDGGSRKKGCKACTSRYNRDYRAANRERLRKPRKSMPKPLKHRVLEALKLGFPLSIYQLWRMLGCLHCKMIVNACFRLQASGLARHERITNAGSIRGTYTAMRWEAV